MSKKLNPWGEPVGPVDRDDASYVVWYRRKRTDKGPDSDATEGGDDTDGWVRGDDVPAV